VEWWTALDEGYWQALLAQGEIAPEPAPLGDPHEAFHLLDLEWQADPPTVESVPDGDNGRGAGHGWQRAQLALDRGELFSLKVSGANRGGLLVDWNGFAFARHGIDDDTAAALSALATDIAAVEQRHAERLRQTLGVSSQGWAAVDAHGASRIGAWPLFIADHRFLIVLQGAPRLNQPQFVELVWLLVSRYG